MSRFTKDDIMQIVAQEDVRFIRLQFTDVFGSMKNVAISASQIERALDNKVMFDGSSIRGFVRIEESDMYLYPDLKTFEILPWRTERGREARIMCDVYRPEGMPFEGDSRYILKKQLARASAMGYTFDVGPECEFFLFDTDADGMPVIQSREKAGYFDVSPLDLGEDTRREIVLTLEEMGFEIEASHHEVAPSQHEVDFSYDNALATADHIMTFKMVARKVAGRHGLFASFMPKPAAHVDGSGLHINMSLHKDGKNVFFDKKDPMKLSTGCRQFIAGLLLHARGMSLITNPLVNSYKRLVPGYEAPVGIAWSESNRSPLIRVPASRGSETRIELRSPDAASNPYLVMALSLAAGLDGMEKGLEAPAPVGANLYQYSRSEMADMNVKNLPQTLIEACEAFDKDPFIREVLGDHICDTYLDAKWKEWESCHRRITQWEIEEYLYKY